MKVRHVIKREFTFSPYQGAAALFASSTAEGLPLIFMSRKGSNMYLWQPKESGN